MTIETSTLNTGAQTELQPHRNSLVRLTTFSPISAKTLEEIVKNLNSSTCCLDTLPTNFFKTVYSALETDLLEIINTSLLSGIFPRSLKTAIVKPLLKKRSLDPSELNNYRPISNLPFIGKIIEKVALIQLNSFLNVNGLLDRFQSGFRKHHSTETALIKVLNDIYLNTEAGKTSVLVLLDLSSAFDTVDHKILLDRLENWVGLSGPVLSWFRSVTGLSFLWQINGTAAGWRLRHKIIS